MFNRLFLFFILFLFTYSAIFTLYFLVIVIAAMFKKRINNTSNSISNLFSRNENDETLNFNNLNNSYYKNLIIIIYSHNNEKTIVNLLEQLNKQDYPKSNYQIHIILDNCSDNSSNKLEFIGGAKLWRLTDDTPLGKDKAISWLLENLLAFKKVDAFVFLNANRIIKNDFLSNINDALIQNDVVVGSTKIFQKDAGFYDKVWANVNEYNMEIMKKGRASLGLAVPIDSDITIIKYDVLEKIKCIDFKDTNSELKYSFLLTKVGYIPTFVPDVQTFVSSSHYKISRPDFLFKMSLFTHCINLKSFTNFKFLEFLFSLFKPNPIILIAMIGIITTYSINYYFLENFPWAIFFGIVLFLTFVVSLYVANMYYVKQILYLITAPVLSLCKTLMEITFLNRILKSLKFKNKSDLKTEKITVPVNVTNGRSVFTCELELISEGGFKKAVFKYKNKKQETNQSYVRMCDAVKNISDILEQHGFRIKICQSCIYFSPKIDGTNNMIKGYCNRLTVNNQCDTQIPETLLWSTCEYFVPQEVNNVIDISKFINKKS